MTTTTATIVARRNAFPAALPDDLLEAPFLGTVIGAALWHGWMVNHQRPAVERSGKWATATQGHRGFPDLVLAKPGRLLIVELKTNRGRLGPGQPEWAAALPADVYRLWRPRNWHAILDCLAS